MQRRNNRKDNFVRACNLIKRKKEPFSASEIQLLTKKPNKKARKRKIIVCLP